MNEAHAIERLLGQLADGEAPPPSDTLLVNEQSRAREAAGGRVVKLGFGQSPFPVRAAAVEALARHAADKAYLPVQGLPAAREAVAAFHRDVDGVDWRAENVLFAPGSKLLLFAAMKALPADTEVLIPDPAWVSYAPQARMCGLAVRRLHADFDSRWQVGPAALEAALREAGEGPRLLILNQPGNPTGLSMARDEQAALAAVARRHGVLVLSDEIYGVLHHRGEHRAFARDYPEGTLTTTGLSKWCGAGGWRFGAMHVPPALGKVLMPRLLGIASETWSSVASPVQEAACVAYTRDAAHDAYVARQRDVLADIGRWTAERLREAGVRVHAPDGGFYLYPDFEPFRGALADRGIADSAALTRDVLEKTDVALLPGAAFGAPPKRLTARLAYVDFDGAALLASEGDAIEHAALGHLREGIDALARYLDG